MDIVIAGLFIVMILLFILAMYGPPLAGLWFVIREYRTYSKNKPTHPSGLFYLLALATILPIFLAAEDGWWIGFGLYALLGISSNVLARLISSRKRRKMRDETQTVIEVD